MVKIFQNLKLRGKIIKAVSPLFPSVQCIEHPKWGSHCWSPMLSCQGRRSPWSRSLQTKEEDRHAGKHQNKQDLCSDRELKAMAPYSSTLAWKIPWTEEPGRLQSMGSLRVGHDWATSLSLFTFMHWRRKWQPTPVFLPGESQGRRGLMGCRLWGRTESDTTEVT